MRSTILAVFLLLSSSACAGNPGGADYVCRSNDGQSCTAFVSGWTEAEALGSCNTFASTFSPTIVCPSGRTANCMLTGSDGRVTRFDWYSPYPLADAAANCDAFGGVFSLN